MSETKIRLSAEEMELLLRSDWILTKNRVIQKAKHLLEMLQADQQNILEIFSNLPQEVKRISPKVSKGENYQGLPWLILDQPRHFLRDHAFAIRHFFWWGRLFSSTLHLSGTYKTKYEKNILAGFNTLKEEDVFICINDDQWEHHFEADNFLPLSGMDKKQFAAIINDNSFIKLSKKFPLDQWNDAKDILKETFNKYLSILTKTEDGNGS